MAKLGLLSPWAIYYNELKTFFEKDCEVTVIYDEENNVVNLYVNNSAKAAALTEKKKKKKDFGAVTLKINVIAPIITSMSIFNITSLIFVSLNYSDNILLL